jgi:hypothetical protein
LGGTVLLRRNAAGRYEVVGPGDRVNAFQTKKTYNFGNASVVATTTTGFSFRQETFSFYRNIANPGASFWNDSVTPFPKITTIDPAGNPV